MKPLNLQTVHLLKKKKTEPCSFKKKGHNTFAKCQPISACAGNGFNESTVW